MPFGEPKGQHSTTAYSGYFDVWPEAITGPFTLTGRRRGPGWAPLRRWEESVQTTPSCPLSVLMIPLRQICGSDYDQNLAQFKKPTDTQLTDFGTQRLGLQGQNSPMV